MQFFFKNHVTFNRFSHRLTTTLRSLIKERSKIEKSYAKNLREWSKYCGAILEGGMTFSS